MPRKWKDALDARREQRTLTGADGSTAMGTIVDTVLHDRGQGASSSWRDQLKARKAMRRESAGSGEPGATAGATETQGRGEGDDWVVDDDGNPHPPGWRRALHAKKGRREAPPEEKSGAVRIQAAFRGRQARRDVDEKKKHQRDGNPHPPGWRRDLHTKQVEEKRAQQRGAVQIQAAHRGRKARKDVEERKEAVQAEAGDREGGAVLGGKGGKGGKGEKGGKGAKRGKGGKGGNSDKGARRGKRAKGGKGGTGSKRNKGISGGKGGKGAKGGKGKAEAAAQQSRLAARMVAAKENRSEEAATRQEEAKRRKEEATQRQVGAKKRREEAEAQASREGQKQLRQKDEALQARIEAAGQWAAREDTGR